MIKVAQVKLLDSVDEDRMFCVEPHMKNKGLLISSTVSPGKSKVPVQIINDLDQFVTLRAGHLVGIATEIHEIIEKGPDIHTTDGVITPEPKVSTSSTSDCSQSEEVLVLLLYLLSLIVANQLRILHLQCLTLIVSNQVIFH